MPYVSEDSSRRRRTGHRRWRGRSHPADQRWLHPSRRRLSPARSRSTAGVLPTAQHTPGKLQVLIDGERVEDCEFGDYQARLCPTTKIDGVPAWQRLRLAQGQQVKLTVIAERASGDWEVGVSVY